LSGIAKAHGTTVADLMKANPYIKDPNKIYAGAKLNMPPGAQLGAGKGVKGDPGMRSGYETAPASTSPYAPGAQKQAARGGNVSAGEHSKAPGEPMAKPTGGPPRRLHPGYYTGEGTGGTSNVKWPFSPPSKTGGGVY
jgi:LysM repeat protein